MLMAIATIMIGDRDHADNSIREYCRQVTQMIVLIGSIAVELRR